MGSAVFTGGQVHGGSFKANSLVMSFGGEAGIGAMVQNVNFNYQQQVSMMYEIGSNRVYYIGGRAQGQASIARVVGPSPLAARFIAAFADICTPADLAFTATSTPCGENASSPGKVDYVLKKSILIGLGASLDAQQVVINEQMQFMFMDLETAG